MLASSSDAVPPLPSIPRRFVLSQARIPGGLCLVLIVGLALLWTASGGWVFPLDDAFITLHNARVLTEGSDPSYGVSALTGATSLVHLALVWLAGLGLPYIAASYLVSCLGAVVLVAGLYRLAAFQGVSPSLAALMALIGLSTAAMNLMNGLETALATAAVAWALLMACGEPSRRLAILCGLMPFIRPELGLLSAILMSRQAWLRFKGAPDLKQALQSIAIDGALVVTVAAPWLAWSFAETGSALPNTMSAKKAFFVGGDHGLAGGLLLTTAIAIAGLGPMVVALPLIRRDRMAPVLWAFTALFLLGFALTIPEVLAQNGKRYAYVLIPIAILALCRLAVTRTDRVAALVILLQVAFCASQVVESVKAVSSAQAQVSQYEKLADWAQARLPVGARLLIHDAGMIAYRTRLPLTDLVGLKSPASIDAHRRWTEPSGGLERRLAVDAIARNASATHALILNDGPNGYWNSLADDLRKTGWQLAPLCESECGEPYRLYTLTPPASVRSPSTVNAERRHN